MMKIVKNKLSLFDHYFVIFYHCFMIILTTRKHSKCTTVPDPDRGPGVVEHRPAKRTQQANPDATQGVLPAGNRWRQMEPRRKRTLSGSSSATSSIHG